MGGINKALLEIHGKTIVEIEISILKTVFQEIHLVTNSPEDFGFLDVPMHRDLIPGKGSLGGLYTGLSLCKGNRAFLAACDMPFLNPDVIEYMLRNMGNADVLIPRIFGRLQPLHSIYSKECLPHIEEILTEDDLMILNLFHKINIKEISEEELAPFDPEFRFIMNLNTPEDLEKARRMALGAMDKSE